MAMRDVNEPSKWVCRLTTFFEGSRDDEGSSGSGLLVHIPGSAKFCILTAGHNIVTVVGGDDKTSERRKVAWAKKIQVNFPGGLGFCVYRDECRVSKVYEANPSSGASEESSLQDYGLIVTDKKKHLDANHPDIKDPGGCGFDILVRDSDILHSDVAVHGYPKGRKDQEMNSSGLNHIDRHALYYSKDTMGGVSGGPAIISKNGLHTAIGIHNYASRATRLTPIVMFEILSWIHDYSLQQVFKVVSKKEPGLYLQATHGTQPNITVRPGVAYFNCVLAVAPQTGSNQHCLHLILPPSATPCQDAPLLFLTLDDGEEPARFTFRKARPGALGQIRIDILKEGSKDKQEFISLCWPGKGEEDRRFLKIKPSKRARHCDFGCITQDNEVLVTKRGAAKLSMYPYEPSDDKAQSSRPPSLPPLYRAVLDRDQNEVAQLLSPGANATFTCTCGTTLLSKAAENGDQAIINMLVKCGASIETMNKDNESPEVLAQRNGHERVSKRLYTLRCQLVEDLLRAAKEGSTDKIRSLLGRGVLPDARNDSELFVGAFSGSSALEIAAQYGHPDAVLLLVRDAKASTTGADQRGWTALHKAAQKGDAMVIQYLLEYGANVNVSDRFAMTALHRAAEMGGLDAIVALCADKQINIDSRGIKDATPLMLAAQNGHIEIVKLLLEKGADSTLRDRNGRTARDRAEDAQRINWENICKLLPDT